MQHELKTDPMPFSRVYVGLKLFEIRWDDRKFAVSDTLKLRETRFTGAEMIDGKPLEYTGREAIVQVVHIMKGPIYGLESGWVIMSIKMLERGESFLSSATSSSAER